MYVPASDTAGSSIIPTSSDSTNADWTSQITMLNQWRNPSDVISVLLIIGGDVIQKALAQLTGGYFAPVAFSFGWVTYSFNTLCIVFGEGCLMPVCDYPSILIDGKSGQSRKNYSWLLGRILRGAQHQKGLPLGSLNITVYSCTGRTTKQMHDWLWWSGILIILVQLGIAAVPLSRDGDWMILLITAIGTGLSLTAAALPRWGKEKWSGRTEYYDKIYCLTQGNGHQHIVIIRNKAGSVNLDDIAASSCNMEACSLGTRVTLAVLSLLWIVVLINVAGLRQNTWYLLSVGLLGMVQNITVASVPRSPGALGLELTLEKRYLGFKAMDALMQTEKNFPSVGAALVPFFFPGGLREAEESFWSGSPGYRILERQLGSPSREKC